MGRPRCDVVSHYMYPCKLLNSQDSALEISQYIGDNVFDYNEAVLGMPVEQYINTIQKDSTWGGAIELAATSSMYKVEIDAVDIQTGVSLQVSKLKLRLKRFWQRIDKYGEDQQFANRALMLYSGIHYDSATVSPLPEDAFDQLDFDTRLFASGEGDDILTCLKDLASALRQKHYCAYPLPLASEQGLCSSPRTLYRY